MFLVGCLAPTLAVMAWATHERLPSTKSTRLAAVQQRLGLGVAAERLDTPTPGVFRLGELELTDIETHAVVLQASMATVESRDGTTHVRLSGVRVAQAELKTLASSVQRALRTSWPNSATIEVDSARWMAGSAGAFDQVIEQHGAIIELTSSGEGHNVSSRRCVVQVGAEERGLRVEATRNRQVLPPATRIKVRTIGVPVPTEWIAGLGVMAPRGGTGTLFAGEATVTHQGGGSSGALSGEIMHAPLADVVQLPIITTVDIHDLKIDWRAGCVTSAEGSVVGGSGVMPGVLAQALSHIYTSDQPGANVDAAANLEFGALGVRFVLSSESLSLWGICPNDGPQLPCIVDADSEVLFGQPDWCAPVPGLATLLATHGSERAAGVVASLPSPQHR